jgi:hypothetical protein
MGLSLNTGTVPVNKNQSGNYVPTGIAALYPPSTREKDSNKSTITGLIKGCGWRGIKVKEGTAKTGNPYKFYQLALYSKSDDGSTKEYNGIINDFFSGSPNKTEEENVDMALRTLHNYYNTFYAVFGTDKKADGSPMFPITNLGSLEEFALHITENAPFEDFYNEEASFKVVNQAESGTSQYYKISGNFPIVESPGFNESKVKFKEFKGNKYDDIVTFTKLGDAGQTDGLLMTPSMDIPVSEPLPF